MWNRRVIAMVHNTGSTAVQLLCVSSANTAVQCSVTQFSTVQSRVHRTPQYSSTAQYGHGIHTDYVMTWNNCRNTTAMQGAAQAPGFCTEHDAVQVKICTRVVYSTAPHSNSFDRTAGLSHGYKQCSTAAVLCDTVPHRGESSAVLYQVQSMAELLYSTTPKEYEYSAALYRVRQNCTAQYSTVPRRHAEQSSVTHRIQGCGITRRLPLQLRTEDSIIHVLVEKNPGTRIPRPHGELPVGYGIIFILRFWFDSDGFALH